MSVGRNIQCSEYFLSISFDLIHFAQSRNPHAVQPHLHKCFDAIAKLEFGRLSIGEQEGSEGLKVEEVEEDASIAVSGTSRVFDILTYDIIAILSAEGEKILLRKVSTT